MIDRDLYFYTNAPTPYRRHMFEMYARRFRKATFHFYKRTTDHPTWALDSSDWAIDYVYDEPQDQIGFWKLKFTPRMLKRFFTQRRGSVYIGQMTTLGDTLLVNLLGFLGLAKVFSFNDAGFAEAVTPRQCWMRKLLGFGTTGVLTPGRMGRRYSKALGFRDDQIINCYFSHDVEVFQRFYNENASESRERIRRRLGVPENAFLIITINRFMALKRIEDAAEALRLVEMRKAELARNMHYLLVGQGDWHAHEPMLASLEKVTVHRMGDVAPMAILPYYCAADLLVFPSEGDIWGLVVNEALSMHVPVICTKVIGAAEMIEDGVNGCTVDPRSPEQIYSALIKIVSDSDLHHRMADAAFTGIKGWNTGRGLDNLEAFLEGNAKIRRG